MTTSQRQADQLGMPYGTACNRLRRQIMFGLVQVTGLDACCKCGESMTEDNYTIEHLRPWFDVDVDLFWDLDNVAFSHQACNRPHRHNPRTAGHGTRARYRRGCRCQPCKDAQNTANAKYRRQRQRQQLGYVPNGTNDMTPRWCSYSEHQMPTEAFAWAHKAQGKLNTICKPCNSLRALAWKESREGTEVD